MSRCDRSEGSLAINGAAKHVIMVPSGFPKDDNELAMSYSFGSNHCAVNLLGNPARSAMDIAVMTIPNSPTG